MVHISHDVHDNKTDHNVTPYNLIRLSMQHHKQATYCTTLAKDLHMQITDKGDLGQCNTILSILLLHVTQRICRTRIQNGAVIEGRQPWRKDAPQP